MATNTPFCTQVTATGTDCGKAAKGRLDVGNTPVCGIHLRAAEQRGEGTRDL